MWKRSLMAVMLAGSFVLAGCASGGAHPRTFDSRVVTLHVANHTGTRLAVSVIWAQGQPTYVGQIQNRSDRRFTLSYVPAARLQAVVEFADGGRTTTASIGVNPGEVLELRMGVDRIARLVPAGP